MQMKKHLFNPLMGGNAPWKPDLCIIFTILAFCIATAIAQGTGFFYSPHYTKVLVLTCLFVAYTGLWFYLKWSGRLNDESVVFMIILLGVLARCGYVLLSGLYERQHDAGAYTGMGTDFVNPGHIGYIEYIYKFHKLPDLNPYELFAYYHPPLHHMISFLWLQLNIMLGVTEDLAFENLPFFKIRCNYLNHLYGLVHHFRVGTADRYFPVIRNINFHTGAGDNLVDGLASLSYHIANFFGVNLDGNNLRRIRAYFFPRLCNCRGHNFI